MIVTGNMVNGCAIAYTKRHLRLVNGLMFEDGTYRWFPDLIISPFSNDVAVLQNRYTFDMGLINRRGDIVLEPVYEALDTFYEGRAFGQNRGSTILFDTAGNVIKKYSTCYVTDRFHDGLAIVSEIDGETHGEEKIDGYVDHSGEFVIPLSYRNRIEGPWIHDDGDIYSEGLIRVRSGEYCGYVDRTNQLVIPMEYRKGTRFSEGLAAVCKDEVYGFIDQMNRLVLPFEYEDALAFSEGIAAVRQSGKWGFIDRTGATVIPFEFESARPFENGMASVRIGSRWGIINREGRFLLPPISDGPTKYHEGIARITMDNKVGVVTPDGRMLHDDIPDTFAHIFWSLN